MKLTPSLFALSLLCACGSSVDVDPGTGGSGTTSSVAATTGATSTAAGTTTTAASTSTSSTSNGGGGPGAGGSGEGGAVTTGEGGSNIGSGGAGGGIPGTGGAPAGSGGGSVEPFLCGEFECEPDEQCCGSQQGVTCIGANDPCQGAVLTCQSAANCPGSDICCLQGDLQNAEAVCTDACEPTQAGPLQLCETADECLDDVPCMEIFGGYKVCSAGFP